MRGGAADILEHFAQAQHDRHVARAGVPERGDDHVEIVAERPPRHCDPHDPIVILDQPVAQPVLGQLDEHDFRRADRCTSSGGIVDCARNRAQRDIDQLGQAEGDIRLDAALMPELQRPDHALAQIARGIGLLPVGIPRPHPRQRGIHHRLVAEQVGVFDNEVLFLRIAQQEPGIYPLDDARSRREDRHRV